MAIAPWLQPPNVLGAIEAGTRAGLAIRQQDTSEIENADRLQLAYDQLNAENQRANESARLRAELASQTLQQRQQEQDALNQYRMGGLDLRAQTVEQQAQTAQQRDQTARAAIEQRAAAAAALDARQRDLMQQRQTFQENKPVTPALTANEVLGKIQQTKEALAATDMTPEKAQTVLNQQADLIDYLKKNFQGVPTPTPSTFDVVTPEHSNKNLWPANWFNAPTPATTNRLSAASALMSAPTTSTGTGERIPVISPDGKKGTVPASQLDEAIREGYRRAD